jgi:hypothetical protein
MVGCGVGGGAMLGWVLGRLLGATVRLGAGRALVRPVVGCVVEPLPPRVPAELCTADGILVGGWSAVGRGDDVAPCEREPDAEADLVDEASGPVPAGDPVDWSEGVPVSAVAEVGPATTTVTAAVAASATAAVPAVAASTSRTPRSRRRTAEPLAGPDRSPML